MKKLGLAIVFTCLFVKAAQALVPVTLDWVCSVCQHVNREGAASCEYCGHRR
jgi:hypothetical protein